MLELARPPSRKGSPSVATMEDLQDIITDISQGCAGKGQRVSNHLAAFIARTILESDPVLFSPEKELSSEGVETLVRMGIARACTKDDPALETIKMQVTFDSTYVRFEEELEQSRDARATKTRDLVRSICGVRPKGGTDFETLTALYRQIFAYLQFVSRGQGGLDGKGLGYADPAAVERAVERELAAALESVFPRIGLKSFVLLGAEEKRLQLEELGRIVTGIRLFNREQGKGGAGLDHVEDAVAQTVSDLREALDAEVAEQHEVCTRYQETLVFCHLRKPAEATPSNLERWAQELANRRQYTAYLASLAEDAAASARRVGVQREAFATEMDELQGMVGGRAAVPKEHVYPKFDSVATAWFALDEELRTVESRVAVLEELHAFRESYAATLGPQLGVVRQARLEGGSSYDQEAPTPEKPQQEDAEDAGFDDLPEADTADAPVRLSVDSTPEFMQLPLEYQGFCGWTCAHKGGLLLPGKPALGVVRYRGAHYVFASAKALRDFFEDPERARAGVVAAAATRPELVHLLRLQDQYPGTSIAKILATAAAQRAERRGGTAGQRAAAGGAAAALLAPPAMRDAGTETPLHFVEHNMDPSYEFSEWALRRRALRLAALKNSATTSCQTDASSYRRDNASQVFLPRISTTQTSKESGTQPELRIGYLQGIRGGANRMLAEVSKTPALPVGRRELFYEHPFRGSEDQAH